jgi:hypothetical protein
MLEEKNDFFDFLFIKTVSSLYAVIIIIIIVGFPNFDTKTAYIVEQLSDIILEY